MFIDVLGSGCVGEVWVEGVRSGMAARLGLRMDPYDDGRPRDAGETFNLTIEQ